MVTRKKILILFASAGHGHEKAAQAIYEAFEKAGPEFEVKIVDALAYAAPLIGPFYRWVYFTQIKYLPWLWAFFYYSSDIAWVYFFVRTIRRMLNGPLAVPLHRFLTRESPSVIITTHFLPTEVTSYLKGRNRIHSKLITVVTDYLPHYAWTAPHVDFYAVAAEETKQALVERGAPENRIRVTGIPIEKKFLENHSKAELLNDLGLAEGCFTVLITGGGAGIGAAGEIAERISRLETPVQVLLVCGTNRALYERMSALSRNVPRIKAFGFVSNMQELMEAADAVIGKGGGLTVTESLAKGKPLIFFRSVPGQEKRNESIAAKYGAGFAAGSVEEVVAKVSELAADEALRRRMAEGVRRLSRPDAASAVLGIVRDEC